MNGQLYLNHRVRGPLNFSPNCETDSIRIAPRTPSSGRRRLVTTSTTRTRSDLQSVDHIAIALDIFAASRNPLTLREFVEQSELPRTTAFRLLTALEQHGFLQRDPEVSTYRLGPRAFLIAELYLSRLDIRTAIRPTLEWLWEKTHLTTHVSILDRTDVVYIDKIDGSLAIQVATSVGGRAPAYAVSAGLAQLAHLDEASLNRHIPKTLEQFAPSTVANRQQLGVQLRKLRDLGYAVNPGGWRSVVGGISAPVFKYDQKVVASIGVVFPSSELREEVIERIVPLVVQAAGKASAELGWRKPE